LITNGSGVVTYQWQSSPNGSSGWANIAIGGNGANYNVPTAVAGTTYYRVLVMDLSNGCNDPISNVLSVTIQNQPTVTIQATTNLLCVGGSSTLTSSVQNGSGNFLYQWQLSPDGVGGWATVGNASSYVVTGFTAGTYYYRVVVTDANSGCADPVSNVQPITVVDQPEVSIAVDNDLVCVGGTSVITPNIINGSGVYNYQWQSSPNGSNGWTNISPNGTNSTYTTIAVTPGTTYYRLLLTDLSNGCNDPVSNTVSITIQPDPTVSIVADNNLICVNGSSTLTSTVSNGSGLFNYQWQLSPDGTNAGPISSSMQIHLHTRFHPVCQAYFIIG
jgi:hypothetical protein